MEKIRLGVVGLGPRGRDLTRLATGFDSVELVAACDIRATNWYDKKWRTPDSFANLYPNATFYEDYDKMLNEADLDAVMVETGADIHADFCIKALDRISMFCLIYPLLPALRKPSACGKHRLDPRL